MTRKEEIEQAALEYSTFIKIRDNFINGAEWADKTMIEKACKWLSNFYQYKLVEDFRKAMEE